MKQNKLIPFWLMPGSWGLKGKTRKIAEAEYYLEGPNLQLMLIDIEHEDKDEKSRLGADLEKLQIQYDAKIISNKEFLEEEVNTKLSLIDIEYEDKELKPEADLEKLQIQYDAKMVSEKDFLREKYAIGHEIIERDFEEDTLEHEIKMLQLDLDCVKITQRDFDRDYAELNNEPWVEIIKFDIDETDLSKGAGIELDFNQTFVRDLHAAGYAGNTEDELVNSWLNQLCMQILMESDYTIEKRIKEATSILSIDKNIGDDGKTRYS